MVTEHFGVQIHYYMSKLYEFQCICVRAHPYPARTIVINFKATYRDFFFKLVLQTFVTFRHFLVTGAQYILVIYSCKTNFHLLT
jgi:hypothetical protein